MPDVLRFVDYDWSLHGGAGSPLTGEILLDISDGTNYCIDEIIFPPPVPRIEWRDPAHGDGRDVSYHKYENREIVIRMQVFGATVANLSTNIRNLWEQLLAPEPVLEWIPEDWTEPLYMDLISPADKIDPAGWFETWMRDYDNPRVLANLEITLQAKPFLRGPEETVTLLNGDTSPPVYAVTGIVVDETNFKGDIPAPADIYIDLKDGELWTDLIFGQRLNYSDDFDPIQEPTAGTQAFDADRLNGDYRSLPAPSNMINNPSFEDDTGVGEFDNWVENLGGSNPGTFTRSNVNPYAGTYCARCNIPAGDPIPKTATYELLSDVEVCDPTKDYFISVFHKMDSWTSIYTTAVVEVLFFDGGVATGSKVIYNSVGGPTSWTEITGYVTSGEIPDPANTDQYQVRLYVSTYWGPGIHYCWWDLVTVLELDSIAVDGVFPLDSHEGRYLPCASVSFAGSDSDDTITLNALLQTAAGDEITTSIAPQYADSEDPNTDFHELAFMSERFPTITIPTHRVSNLADKSNINQILRLATDTLNTQAFYFDYVGIIPTDRSYIEVRNWSGNEHLILDSRSSHLPLSSLTGSLDDAMVYDINAQRGEANFVADPNGFNGTILALTLDSGDYKVASIVDVTMVYSPLYLLVPEEP